MVMFLVHMPLLLVFAALLSSAVAGPAYCYSGQPQAGSTTAVVTSVDVAYSYDYCASYCFSCAKYAPPTCSAPSSFFLGARAYPDTSCLCTQAEKNAGTVKPNYVYLSTAGKNSYASRTAADGFTHFSSCSTDNCNNQPLPCGTTAYNPVVSFNLTLAGYTSATFGANETRQLTTYFNRILYSGSTQVCTGPAGSCNWTVSQVFPTVVSNVTITMSTPVPAVYQFTVADFMVTLLSFNPYNASFASAGILTACTATYTTDPTIDLGPLVTGVVAPGAAAASNNNVPAAIPATSGAIRIYDTHAMAPIVAVVAAVTAFASFS